MLEYSSTAYSDLFGKINDNAYLASVSCIGQCTGCKCSCQCSCSGGIISDIEWEVF
ncbi:FibroRumin family radical SAM-modified Cys-rich RiPP [Desulfovibrio litoralis]|uniref:FibroRumin family radical SAM-modified Cys-rich RiPP n=1 Tax=Desulfovibrio litoralis TaxID=466107 RepID=UPI0009321D2E